MRGSRKRKSRDGAGSQHKKSKYMKKKGSTRADVSDDLRQEVENLYKLPMPEDFYHFWKFCEELDSEKPAGKGLMNISVLENSFHHELYKDSSRHVAVFNSYMNGCCTCHLQNWKNVVAEDALLTSLGLQLVGPFDILSGKHKVENKSTDLNFNLHWRFYYDPPEFQTIVSGDDKTQYHMGYFRDSPDELPVCVGVNEAKINCTIVQNGDNVFAAVKLFLVKKIQEETDKKKTDLLQSINEKLTEAARKLGYSLEQKSMSMKQRDKKVVTKTFHSAGLVVPIDKNDVGYRDLPETDANLKIICKMIVEASSDEQRMKAFAPIQEMVTFVQFANDECDYGMGLELGIDLFCYGSQYFHKVIGQLLPLAYKLLKRNLFAEIIEAHLANRSKENVDQLAT